MVSRNLRAAGFDKKNNGCQQVFQQVATSRTLHIIIHTLHQIGQELTLKSPELQVAQHIQNDQQNETVSTSVREYGENSCHQRLLPSLSHERVDTPLFFKSKGLLVCLCGFVCYLLLSCFIMFIVVTLSVVDLMP